MKLGKNLYVLFALFIVSVNSTIFSQEGAKAPLGENHETIDVAAGSSPILNSGGPGGPPIGGEEGTTGIADYEQNSWIISYNNGSLFISNDKGIEDVNIFCITGKLLFNEIIHKVFNYQNYINAPSGIYIVVVRFSDGLIQTQKIKIK